MTARALQFIKPWLQENLGREPYTTHPVEGLEALLRRCVEEADAQGVTLKDIEEEIGDLQSFIREALESTADEEGEDESDTM